jgi:hypothetical protein
MYSIGILPTTTSYPINVFYNNIIIRGRALWRYSIGIHLLFLKRKGEVEGGVNGKT